MGQGPEVLSAQKALYSGYLLFVVGLVIVITRSLCTPLPETTTLTQDVSRRPTCAAHLQYPQGHLGKEWTGARRHTEMNEDNYESNILDSDEQLKLTCT